LASALALGGTGCSDDGQNKSAQEYAQSAENRSIVHRVNADYNKAQYLQLIEIVENNNQMLETKGTSVDISDYLNKAQEYAENAENTSFVHRVNADYNRAQYELNQAILKQQEALK